MLLRINHATTLSYTAPVAETVLEVRMAPPSDEDQTALSYRLRITPRAPVTSFRDGFGNRVDLFNVTTPYRELVIEATSFVRTHRRSALNRLEPVSWPPEGLTAIDAVEFLQPSPLVDRSEALDECVAKLSPATGSLADVARRAMDALAGRLKYEKRVTTTRTPVSEALALGRGVCQDFAHLFVGICRGLGLPTRYVSGYVNHPGEIATHAWCQIWAGTGMGWIDVDPTRGEFPGDDYVVIAVGRDYSDIPPEPWCLDRQGPRDDRRLGQSRAGRSRSSRMERVGTATRPPRARPVAGSASTIVIAEPVARSCRVPKPKGARPRPAAAARGAATTMTEYCVRSREGIGHAHQNRI